MRADGETLCGSSCYVVVMLLRVRESLTQQWYYRKPHLTERRFSSRPVTHTDGVEQRSVQAVPSEWKHHGCASSQLPVPNSFDSMAQNPLPRLRKPPLDFRASDTLPRSCLLVEFDQVGPSKVTSATFSTTNLRDCSCGFQVF